MRLSEEEKKCILAFLSGDAEDSNAAPSHYVKAFEEFCGGKKPCRWNWKAFLTGGFSLMYHGNYFLALISLVPIVLSSLFLSMDKMWLSALFFVIQILFNLFIGFFCDYCFFCRYKKCKAMVDSLFSKNSLRKCGVISTYCRVTWMRAIPLALELVFLCLVGILMNSGFGGLKIVAIQLLICSLVMSRFSRYFPWSIFFEGMELRGQRIHLFRRIGPHVGSYEAVFYLFSFSGARTHSDGRTDIWTVGKKRNIPSYHTEMFYDGEGRLIAKSYRDWNGHPVVYNQDYARMEVEYDEYGNVACMRYYSSDKDLSLCADGYAITKWNHDEQGNRLWEKFFDSDGNPCLCANGYAEVHWGYDDRGNRLWERCYNTAGNLCLCSQGYAEIFWEYDENGEIISYRCLDAEGNPTKWNGTNSSP